MSSRSRRGAAAAGRTTASASAAQSAVPAPAPKVDPIMALFRRECAHMLSTPLLPPHLSASAHNALINQEIEVLAAMERISTSGSQQSVQICRVGGETGETWVTRTEGERRFFPVVGRVSKRARSPPPEEQQVEGDDAGAMDEDGQAKPQQETPAAKRRSRRAPAGRSARPPASSSSYATENDAPAPPQAPKKARRAPRPVAEDPVSEDEGGQTEREGSVAGRGGSASVGRRSARLNKGKGRAVVKTEPTADDLDSLCGRVGGLGMGSVAGSEAPEFGEDIKPDLASLASGATFNFEVPSAMASGSGSRR